MSKNDMVMVPRNAVENAAELLQEYNKCSIARDLCALLDQPAQQHQGVPVVLPARESLNGRLPGHEAIGWNACLDEIAKLNGWVKHGE